MENMNNGVVNNTQAQVQQVVPQQVPVMGPDGQVVQTAPVPQQVPMQQVPVQTVVQAQPEQPGFWKRNWKKILAIGGAVTAALGSAGAAFAIGKKHGQQQCYSPSDDGYDNPLNPNV